MAARIIEIVSVEEQAGGNYQITYLIDGSKRAIRWASVSIAIADIISRDSDDALITMVLLFAQAQDATLKSMVKLAGQTITFDMTKTNPMVSEKK